MCLLDQVARWDETRIVCLAAAPTADHPFGRAEGVPAIVAVEYAAQAAAVHSVLLDGHIEPRGGVLATLSEVELSGGWLNEASGALAIDAELVARDGSGCLYSFVVHDEHGCRARGRLLVAFTGEPTVRTPEGGLAPDWREGTECQRSPNGQ